MHTYKYILHDMVISQLDGFSRGAGVMITCIYMLYTSFEDTHPER